LFIADLIENSHIDSAQFGCYIKATTLLYTLHSCNEQVTMRNEQVATDDCNRQD